MRFGTSRSGGRSVGKLTPAVLFLRNMPLRARTVWDAEASSDVPGLATEAHTLDALKARLDVFIPELLAANRAAAEPSPGRARSSITAATRADS